MLKKIASFTINHDTLTPGMYVSRIDGDVVTYDLRMKVPNAGDYLSNGALHTFEHLFATYARNSALSDSVIYVGPMGCRTGFYLESLLLSTPGQRRLSYAQAMRGVSLCTQTASLQKRVP